ncbi:MAG: hypothetical protein EOP58_06905 [Sphingomonadales bacterium]|nr:MAG: hypothetical protein EOP58_06905 [Sphingomonadales bacterium]
MIRHLPLILAAASFAAGCSAPEQANNSALPNVEDLTIPPDEIMNASPANDALVNTGGNATIGGDGSQIELEALSDADLSSETFEGELGCSFSLPGASPLLVAKGNVASKDSAQGVVKVAGYVERVAAPGGYDGMAKGVTFSGKGKTVRIAMTGAAQSGGESPLRPATLTYQRADGAERTFTGQWGCGP